MGKPNRNAFADLHGVSQLAIAAVTGVTDIVEDMHRHIAGVAPLLGHVPAGRTTGITGLVYRCVRGVTRAVGVGLDATLAQLSPLLESAESSARREAGLAALNGVLGDHLVATRNPLAIQMHLRQPVPAGGKLLVLVHGLCMNDLQWTRKGHNHGLALARDLGFTPLFLHYNTGVSVATNGREFSSLLERLLQESPVPVEELVIVGHSMGGLVARSACHIGEQEKASWVRTLKALVFLGTPHLGAPLERAGERADMLLGISPYTAPFVRLGQLRSQGIQDLRKGLLDDQGLHPLPLPEGVACFAVSASLQRGASSHAKQLRGDGLVPVNSALGQDAAPNPSLDIPPAHRAVCYGTDHFDLLSSAETYGHLLRWLGATPCDLSRVRD